jgi:hypothetical protein
MAAAGGQRNEIDGAECGFLRRVTGYTVDLTRTKPAFVLSAFCRGKRESSLAKNKMGFRLSPVG